MSIFRLAAWLLLLPIPVSAELITFDSGSPFGMLPADATFQPKLIIHNLQDTAKKAKLTWRLTDPEGAGTAEGSRDLDLPPQSSVPEPIPRPKRHGIYRLAVEVTETDGEKSHGDFRFLLPFPEAPPTADGFLFGVHAHIKDRPAAEQEIMAAAIEACGIRVVRETATWSQLQPKPDVWSFQKFDRLKTLLERHRLEWLPVLCFNTPWATAADWKPVSPSRDRSDSRRPDYNAFGTYARTFLFRYRNDIRFIEVWNEPDLLHFANFSAAEYAGLLERVFKAARESAPEVRVMTGGFASMTVPEKASAEANFVRKCIELGKGRYDLFNIHIHGPFLSYVDDIARMEKARRELGDDTPWYSGETAISSSGGVTEDKQAAVLVQKLIYAWSRNAVGFNWYNLVEKKQFPEGHKERHFGLLTPEFQPKSAYAAYRALTANFQNAEFDKTLYGRADTDLFLFRSRKQNHLLAGWTRAAEVRLVLLNTTARAIERYDLWGNCDELPVAGHSAGWILGPEPQTLSFPAEAEPTVAGVFPVFSGPLILLPERKTRIVFGTLSNPEKHKRRYRVAIAGEPALKCAPGERIVEVPPLGSAEVAFELTLAAGTPASRLRFQVTPEGGTLCEVSVAIKAAYPVPEGKFNAVADFVLTGQERYTGLVPPHPGNEHLFYSGPEDLSAEIRLARDSKNLLIQVKVKDDRHVTVPDRKTFWEGDSLQVALALPGRNSPRQIGLASGGMITDESVTGTVRRNEERKETLYELAVPLRSADPGGNGFRLNILVNDNDGECRKGYLSFGKERDTWPEVCF